MNAMKFTFFTFLIFAGFASRTAAQSVSAEAIFDSVNLKIASVKQGYYDASYCFKSAPKDDTSSLIGRVYFFKNDTGRDTFRQFAAFVEGQPQSRLVLFNRNPGGIECE